MKLERIIAALAASSLALTLVACGGTESEETAESADTADVSDTTDVSDAADETAPADAYVIDGVTVYDPTIDYSTVTFSDGLDENGYIEGVKALDYVKLPEYVGVDISSSDVTVSEEELNGELMELARNYSDKATEVEPRAAVVGDLLRVSYTSTIDGESYPGGDKDEDYIPVGGYYLAEGLTDAFVGMKPGDVLDASFVVPEDFANYEYIGKNAVAVFTVEAVLEPDYDAIALAQGFDGAEELIEDIEDYILSSKRFAIFTDLVAKAECENVPAVAIKYLISVDLSDYAYYAMGYGVTFEEFLQTYVGYESVTALIDDRLDLYRENAKSYVVAQAMAEEQGITVTDEMLEEAGYGASLIESYGKPYLKQFLLFQEVLPAFVLENAK